MVLLRYVKYREWGDSRKSKKTRIEAMNEKNSLLRTISWKVTANYRRGGFKLTHNDSSKRRKVKVIGSLYKIVAST